MVPGLGDSLRAYVYALIEDEDGQGPTRQAVDGVLVTLIVLSVGADILGTVKSIHEEWYALIRSIDVVSTLAFTIEYIVRLWVCVEDRDGRYNRPVLGRMRYAVTPLAIADLMAILPFYLYFLLPDELRLLRLFRLMRVLKLARYSPALRVIEVVLLNQRQPLLAALSVVAVLLIISSGLMYFAEHQAQPEAFGSIPAAMWWAAVTMSTVGYGDVTPVTVAGKALAGVVSLLGIGMFALPTAILGAGFMEELQKYKFSTIVAIVARAEIFSDLSPGQIAELAAMLNIRRLPSRYTIIHAGEHADAMYFIDEGKVVLRNATMRRVLGPGDFFGERALLDGHVRTVTVVTLNSCRLLELRAGDFHNLIAKDGSLREAIVERMSRDPG